MDSIKVKRSDAAKALDAIASVMCHWHNSKGTADDVGRTMSRIQTALRDAGIQADALKPCDGEAHSNAFIDHCSQCAPRWGVVGPEIKVT